MVGRHALRPAAKTHRFSGPTRSLLAAQAWLVYATHVVTGFSCPSDELLCDGVPLSAIAAAVGTPVYVYSAALLREQYRAIDAAFGDYPHALHYALKANSSLALTRLLRELGSAADANSIWEIQLALRAGFTPADLVFTGVGKAPSELEAAVPLGLKAINVESNGELDRVEAIAARTGRVARVAVRINPDVDANSHPHISTGLKAAKFGIPHDAALDILRGTKDRPSLRLVALHVHVGSQLTRLDPLRRSAACVADLADDLARLGIALEYLDLGGGLGISYDGEPVPTPAEYGAMLVGEIRRTGLPIVVEPGRAIAGPAGVVVARVVDIKPQNAETDFAVVDAGMTEIIRPALYGAYHRIEPVRRSTGPTMRYDVVGPVCESSDVIGRDRSLPALSVGDLIAIRDAGAYGSSMASNYNRRPLPAEVVVDAGRWRITRRRQTLDDMLALDES
jgi:diaminopimelate decarboxylase